MADLLFKQLFAVIDHVTTVVCLHAAGQIRGIDEAFETLNGNYMEPPFHIRCRSKVTPWMPGFVNEQRKASNAELLLRPLAQRRIGPNGELGVRLPPPPRVFVMPDFPIPVIPAADLVAPAAADAALLEGDNGDV